MASPLDISPHDMVNASHESGGCVVPQWTQGLPPTAAYEKCLSIAPHKRSPSISAYEESPLNSIDPHHLVAMAAHTIKPAISSGVNRRHEPTGDLILWNSPDGDGATNEGKFPILEVFASICVWKPTAQVIAVSLQKDDTLKRMCLTIAGNSGVDPKVISHVEEVWGMLKELSDLYAKERSKKSDRKKRRGWTKGSPKVPVGVGENQRQLLVWRVYMFSILKNKKRIKKWWRRLDGFAQQLQGNKPMGEATRSMAKFQVGVHMLRQVIPMLQRASYSIEDWGSVVKYMDAAMVCFQPLLDDSTLCELWASEQKNGAQEPFPLRRALEKITIQYRHIQVLIAFANSPRLRYAFEYVIAVRAVPESAHVVSLPPSASDWSTVIRNICHGDDFGNLDDFLESESVELANKYPQTQECCVHCECSLIVFLESKHNDNWDSIPTFSFIGTSRLSCASCSNWLKGFNKLGGRRYITKGTHGKYYWPWGMPLLEDSALNDRLADSFAGLVRSEYLKLQVLSGRFRTPSDSTDASLRGAEAEIPEPMINEIERLERMVLEGSSLMGF